MRAGGGTPAGAAAAASWLIEAGATGLVSFGLAGGLDPALRPGTVVLPGVVLSEGNSFAADADLAARFGGLTRHTVLAANAAVADAASKTRLFTVTGAHVVDLESGAVAREAQARGLPFIVVRAVCDPAERDLPPAALLALDGVGRIRLSRVLWSVVRQPVQVAGLIALGRDAARARQGLVRLAK